MFPGFGTQPFGTSPFGWGARDLTVRVGRGRSRAVAVTAVRSRTVTVTPRVVLACSWAAGWLAPHVDRLQHLNG